MLTHAPIYTHTIKRERRREGETDPFSFLFFFLFILFLSFGLIMSSILSSQGVVLATAMAVSSTIIFLAFSRHQLYGNNNSQLPNHTVRSCLSSGGKKKERKKKRVKFAENVKEPSGNGEEYRKGHCKRSTKVERICRSEIPGFQRIPANRVALYNGILRDRVHRMECSY